MLKRIHFAAALVLLAAGAGPGSGQERQHEIYLGEANVDGAVDHDSIKVGTNEGRFRAIQLRVEKNPIHFDHVVVRYIDGSSQTLEVRGEIPAGGATRVIDLPGERRILRSVDLWYARANWGGQRPRVTLWGLP